MVFRKQERTQGSTNEQLVLWGLGVLDGWAPIASGVAAAAALAGVCVCERERERFGSSHEAFLILPTFQNKCSREYPSYLKNL